MIESPSEPIVTRSFWADLGEALYRLSLILLFAWSVFVFGEAGYIWYVISHDPDGRQTQTLLELSDAYRSLLFPGGRPMEREAINAFVTSMMTARIINWLPVAIPVALFALFVRPRDR